MPHPPGKANAGLPFGSSAISRGRTRGFTAPAFAGCALVDLTRLGSVTNLGSGAGTVNDVAYGRPTSRRVDHFTSQRCPLSDCSKSDRRWDAFYFFVHPAEPHVVPGSHQKSPPVELEQQVLPFPGRPMQKGLSVTELSQHQPDPHGKPGGHLNGELACRDSSRPKWRNRGVTTSPARSVLKSARREPALASCLLSSSNREPSMRCLLTMKSDHGTRLRLP